MATPATTGIELVTSGMSDTEVPRQATSDPLPLCVTTGMRTPPNGTVTWLYNNTQGRPNHLDPFGLLHLVSEARLATPSSLHREVPSSIPTHSKGYHPILLVNHASPMVWDIGRL